MNTTVTQRVNQFLHEYPILSGSSFLKHDFADPAKKDVLWSLIPVSPRSLTVGSSFENPFSDHYLHMLLYIRNLFKELYVSVEGQDIISQKTWSSSQTHGLHGGGIMTVIRGDVLEK